MRTKLILLLAAGLAACSGGESSPSRAGISDTRAVAGAYASQRLAAEAARLEAAVAALGLLPGERGEPGEKGPDGPPGPLGAAGADLPPGELSRYRALATDAVVRNYGANLESVLRGMDADLAVLETDFALLQGLVTAIEVVDDGPNEY